MLINYPYQATDKKTDKESDIFKCCRKEAPDDPKCDDCCYDTWRDEQKEVVDRYNRAKETADQVQRKLVFIVDRRNRYKMWLDELTKADEQAREICNSLEILASQVDKIWYNACKAVQAIEILFCMIRDFYIQVDRIKDKYNNLLTCANASTDPSLVNKEQGILKCLTEYSKRLDEIIKTRDDIVKAIVEAIRAAILIRNNISVRSCDAEYNPCDPNNTPCSCGEIHEREYNAEYGLKDILCEWYRAFGCCIPCEDKDPCNETDSDKEQHVPRSKQLIKAIQETSPESSPCDQEPFCELAPFFTLPLCNDDYRNSVNEWYRNDDACVKKLTTDLKNANKEKEALQACKQSLDKAIAEVDPKLTCK